MSLTLLRNSHDPQMLEVLETHEIAGQPRATLWAVVCVDAVKSAARGGLAEKVDCIRYPTKVVVVLEEEWNEVRSRSG